MPYRTLMGNVFDVVEDSRAVFNDRTPFNEEIRVAKDVVYKTVGGKDLFLDIYFPSKPAGEKTPVILDIPGGGWMISNRSRRGGYARLFAVMGACVFVVEHRLCPDVRFPDNLADVVDAYNFICEVAPQYNLDPENITVTGDSSGGHLAACLGCVATDNDYGKSLGLPPLVTKPAGMIFISGAFSFEHMYRIPLSHTLIVRHFSGQNSRSEFRKWKYYRQSDPCNYINSDFPETFNIGGRTDPLCPGEVARMSRKLTKAGVKNEHVVGKNIFNSGHCYNLRLPFAPARKDMVKLYGWYCDKQGRMGVNMAQGYGRVRRFLQNYNKALKGSVEI